MKSTFLKIEVFFAVLAGLFFLAQTSFADWTSRIDEFKKEMYNVVTTAESTAQEKAVAASLSECAAVNILARMDFYSCKDTGNTIAEAHEACYSVAPRLRDETAVILLTCFNSVVSEIEGR